MSSYEPLAERYGRHGVVVRRAGQVYPVAVEATPRGIGELLVVRPEPLNVEPALSALGEIYRATVTAARPGVFDGPVLALDRVVEGALVAAPSSYFRMLESCDALLAEYVEAAPGRALPLRDRAERLATDVLRCGTGRAAAIGVTVVTTVPARIGRSFVVGRRSSRLATDPGRWHVVPSGMLEPRRDALLECVRRELAEELGVSLPAAMLARRLTVLGFAYDLLRLRPEICLRLDLDAAELPAPQESEIATPGGARDDWTSLPGDEYEDAALVGVSRDALAGLWERHSPQTLTPAAAGALALLDECRKCEATRRSPTLRRS